MIRDLQQQLEHMPHAILPLLSLGSEWDTAALWQVVCTLDSRLAGVPFHGDNLEDAHKLEAALDCISSEIIDLVREPAQRLLPGVSLSRGLIDGEWALYAVIPHEVTLPSLDQLSLW